MSSGRARWMRIDHRQRQARGGVHRQIEGDELNAEQVFELERLPREIQRAHVNPFAPQPRRRRGEAERLAAQVVG